MRPFLFALAALVTAPMALAQVPVCNPAREGMAGCFDGRLCLCRFEPGGELTGRAPGHRWDCGAFRPDCRPSAAGVPGPGPWAPPPWPSFVPPPQILLDPRPPR